MGNFHKSSLNDKSIWVVPEVMNSVIMTYCHLNMQDEEKEDVKTVQRLAQHHPETLRTKLHEVCLLLVEEVL